MALGKRKNDASYGQDLRDDLIDLVESFNPALQAGYLHPLVQKKIIAEREDLSQLWFDSISGKCVLAHQRFCETIPRKSREIKNNNYLKVRDLRGRQPMLSDVQGAHIIVAYWVGKESIYIINTMDIVDWKVGEKEGNYNRIIFAMPHGERITLIQKEFGVQLGGKPGGWTPPGEKILAIINRYGIVCGGRKLWKPNETIG